MHSAHDSNFCQHRTVFDSVQRKMWWWLVWSLCSRANSWASINVAQSSICICNCVVLGQPLSSAAAVHWETGPVGKWETEHQPVLPINKTVGIIHDSLTESLDWMFTCFIHHLLYSCLEVCALDWSFSRLGLGGQFPMLLHCVFNVQQRSLCITRPQVSGLCT